MSYTEEEWLEIIKGNEQRIRGFTLAKDLTREEAMMKIVFALMNGVMLAVVGIVVPNWRFWLMAVWGGILIEAGIYIGKRDVTTKVSSILTTANERFPQVSEGKNINV